MMTRSMMLVGMLVLIGIALASGHGDHDNAHGHAPDRYHGDDEEPKAAEGSTDEEMEYHKGSLCGYCEYCKFCTLCEKDCPCEVGPTRPNCHMCKYCKYCYMCKVCDTVCQPGGVIDRVTSKIFGAIPRYNKDEIDKDIDGVKTWIDKTKEEL